MAFPSACATIPPWIDDDQAWIFRALRLRVFGLWHCYYLDMYAYPHESSCDVRRIRYNCWNIARHARNVAVALCWKPLNIFKRGQSMDWTQPPSARLTRTHVHTSRTAGNATKCEGFLLLSFTSSESMNHFRTSSDRAAYTPSARPHIITINTVMPYAILPYIISHRASL